MTEEIKKKAELNLNDLDDRGFDFDEWSIQDAYVNGAIFGAETTTKELEQKNNRLEQDMHLLEDLLKQVIKMYGIVFQCKEVDGNWYDVDIVPFIPTFNARGDYRIKPNTKLEKAKEIIKEYVNWDYGDHTNCLPDITKKAEQFLKE